MKSTQDQARCLKQAPRSGEDLGSRVLSHIDGHAVRDEIPRNCGAAEVLDHPHRTLHRTVEAVFLIQSIILPSRCPSTSPSRTKNQPADCAPGPRSPKPLPPSSSVGHFAALLHHTPHVTACRIQSYRYPISRLDLHREPSLMKPRGFERLIASGFEQHRLMIPTPN